MKLETYQKNNLNNNMNEFIIVEKFDYQNAYKLLNSNIIDDEHKAKLKKYLTYSDGGKVKVKYIQNEIGRLNIKVFKKNKVEDIDEDTCAVQSYMKRVVKGALCNKYYRDIDIDNAHPVFLLDLFSKLNFDVEYLKLYVNDRQTYFDIFNKINIDRDATKVLLLKVMYGGGFKKWCVENKCEEKNIPELFTKLKDEISINTEKLLKLNDYEKFKDYAIEKKGKSYYNINGTALSFVAQTIECKMLLLMREFFENNGFSVGALIHDGLHIEKKGLNKKVLDECSDYLYQKTNIRVNLSFKKFFVHNDLNDYVICQNQKEAADYITDKLKEDLYMCNEMYIIKHRGVWNMNPKVVKRLLQDIVPTYNLLQPVMDGLVPCNKNTKNINDIIQLVRGTEDSQFLNKLFFSNLKKICFDDGYYDFTKRRFIKGFNSIMTTKKISRGYPMKIQKDIDIVYKEILNPIFDDDIEFRDYFLHYIARGLAGHIEDKAWAVGQGERNSGKGVLGGFLNNAFECYVSTTNSENFIMKQGCKGDEAKSLSWLVDFMFVRLMITNEITIDAKGNYVLNGNILKKLSSGGDEIEARKNYQDEIKFKVQCRPILFCNDLPKIEPKDALETLCKFEFPCQFVSDKKKLNPLAKIKKADESIKDKCRQDKYINAFIHIILDNYDQTPKPLPSCVKESTTEATTDENDDTENILNIFEITGNDSDYIPCTDVNKLVNIKYEIAASPQKIYKVFQTKNVYKKKFSKKKTNHYFGIKYSEIHDKNWVTIHNSK